VSFIHQLCADTFHIMIVNKIVKLYMLRNHVYGTLHRMSYFKIDNMK
jgi:hypothetical protein